MPFLELKDVTVIYPNGKSKKLSDGVIGLNKFSTTFEEGSFNVILGYSGCGKSTLLKAIIGLVPLAEGKILFNGIDYELLTMNDKRLSYVSQEYALYPHMTVFDNIAFPLRMKGSKRKEIIEEVNKVAEELGLTICLSRRPKDLSGGQQQRVALARAIVKKPMLLLFDEPLSNVDPKFRAEERNRLKLAAKQTQATSLYVTHDFNEALNLADKIYVLNDGKLVFEGTPKELLNTDNQVVDSLRKASK